MKISVCIITKNECEKLKKCLESIQSYGWETIVVDTGSTDGTMEMLQNYADVVGEFTWCNDFSKARNYSISLASNDWILVLDSDEWLESCDADCLDSLLQKSDLVVGRIERINDMEQNGQIEKGHERISRIFNRQFYEYRGRIHEQVCSKDGTESIYEEVPVTIGHSGYVGTPEEKRAKAGRNIQLLQLDLAEFGPDPYVLYQLGKSYYMQKQYEEAAGYVEEGLGFDLDPKLEYVQDMVETYGYTLLQLQRFSEMMFLREIYEEFAVTADYMFLMGLAYMNNAMFVEAINEFEKATRHKICKVEGCNGFKAWYNIGVIYECLEKKEEALKYYKKCGGYQPAQKGIARLQ